MTLIDYRVLVGAPPEIVWELLSSLPSFPKWHVNCSQSSILTTQQEGAGVRCRLNMQAGPDIVLEILSWYNNLGYEYTVVDGPYRANKGRIRLQAITEGTTVQWTFEYELGGFAAGVRDVNTRRRLTHEVEASLKRLKKLVESAGVRMDDRTRARVSMRPAPTAKERAVLSEKIARTQATMQPVDERVPRHRTPTESLIIDEDDLPPVPEPLIIGEDDLPPAPSDLETALANAEPPLAEDDTRPNPAVAADPSAPDSDAELSSLDAEEASPEDEPQPLKDDPYPPGGEIYPPGGEIYPPGGEIYPPGGETHPLDAVETLPESVEPAGGETEHLGSQPDRAAGSSRREEAPVAPAAEEPVGASLKDSMTLGAESLVKDVGPSIWEVFGMAPPSAVTNAPAEPVAPEVNAPAESVSSTEATASAPAARPPSGGYSLHPRSRKTVHPGQRRSMQRHTRRRS